ncbi:MAG TPA: orotidine-5'-phosphate decarboxylase [Spirochaetota bacterium]|jgi:orotidine-5'-phosphate decarboxylase|nr:orotidine-5'-phosphate decarboxylase [Spirochaetota bacterium]HOK01215.1 orotidine-5'-phosphate decarboxylase [Spirochaetota bacterium]HOK91574.1 orotidine-5'-phosphate decarboxylase [Spirochaetota bacterium]HON16565.1 orotidine-5'-phosphate decarboxylase [Spirochaetota bacterium]HOV07970.1 orotidine-5'-phosphate decarboxylase [Spirochaetota bacterium]
MNYIELLKNSADKFSSIVCFGMDPVIEDIPEKGTGNGEIIFKFYENILNELIKKNILPGAVKPNYAFYAQYGLEGIATLEKLIKIYKSAGIPVILDYKRGDIGKTAAAYSREAFDFFDADAVTLSPYLGYDSIEPYIKGFPEKGYYILTKTSNSSSGQLQDLKIDNKELFLHVAELIIQWYHPGIGSVAGATYPEQLSQISNIFEKSGKEIPFLIPGVGTQGGSLQEVMAVLKKSKDIRIHRINASSSINYAYKKYNGIHYAEAAAIALKEMNEEIEGLK